MPLIISDRVRETSTTTGTGALTLAGAATGYRAFSAVMAVGDTCYYSIAHQTDGTWEVGLGTYSSASVLTRTSVSASSNANAAVNFAAGTKDVFLTVTKTQIDTMVNIATTVNSGTGNAITITAGAGNSGVGGAVNITGGAGSGSNNGGDISIIGGALGTSGYAGQVTIDTIHVGRGRGRVSTNTAAGVSVLAVATGTNNTAFGYTAMTAVTSGSNNSAFGYRALVACTSNNSNCAFGSSALVGVTTGYGNIGIGSQTLTSLTTTNYNTAVGDSAGTRLNDGTTYLVSPSNGTYIGGSSRGFAFNETDAIVIGFLALGNGSYTTVIGKTTTVSTDVFGTLKTTLGAATQKGLIVKGFTSQTASLAEFQNVGGTALSLIRADGSTKPAQLTDAAAVNDSIYYSTTQSKLVYKDSAGVVNILY